MDDIDHFVLRDGRGLSTKEPLCSRPNSFTFMDASILGVLVDARQRISAAGGTLQVRCRTPHRRRMLSITGLDDMLDHRA